MPAPLTSAYPSLPITTFRGEEGYITFYKESDFPVASTPRSSATAVGTYLFYLGMTYSQTTTEHPPYQSYGSRTRAIRAAEVTGAALNVSALLTQENDPFWLKAGHPALRAYIDFVDSWLVEPRAGDVLNSELQHTQTIIVRDLTCTSKKLVSTDDQLITYSIDFVGGEAQVLPANLMDYPSLLR